MSRLSEGWCVDFVQYVYKSFGSCMLQVPEMKELRWYSLDICSSFVRDETSDLESECPSPTY